MRGALAVLLLTLPATLRAQTVRESAPRPTEAFGSLVAAERAFSSAASKDGMRDAFLANMSDDAIVFSPHATSAKTLWTSRGRRPGLLGWAPAVAGVSLAGDMGYTTGPWTWRAAVDSPVVERGSFVTIWKYTANGWRFALDDGISYDSVPLWPDTVAVGSPAGSRRWKTHGVVAELRHFDVAGRGTTAPCTLFLRPGHAPWSSKAPDGVGELTPLAPEGGGVSRSGDLAYTYGRAGKDGKANYLRIWRRGDDGHWRVVLDRRG